MTLWMASAVAASALLGLAAWLAEGAARGRGDPGRWAWASALAGTLVLPLHALTTAPGPASAAPGVAVAESAASATALVDWMRLLGQAPAWWTALDPWVVPGWVVLSGALGLALLGGLARLAVRAGRWPRVRADGVEVLVSENFGPAVLGVLHPRVVLPRWALRLPAHRRRLIVLHEDEHRRAGDPALLVAATVATVAVAWNPVAWWLLFRLRAAVEMDCDARVVRRGVRVADYGRLLLELGTRPSGGGLPVPAFARPPSLLERRVTTMVRGQKRPGGIRLSLTLAAAAALVVAACETPTASLVPAESPDRHEMDGPAGAERSAGPESVLRHRAEGNPSPRIFVDGRLMEGVPADLSPDAIDRVEVIKGDAGERLFGPEGRHGVIQIFTKAGAGGADRTDDTGAREATFGTMRFRVAPTEGERSAVERPDTGGELPFGSFRFKLRPGG
ncbi:MAG: M56 family metallopeptidase [Longimicrobiales bacterium]